MASVKQAGSTEKTFEGRSLHELHQGITGLFKDGQFSDVTVVIDGKHFKCHRVILSAMSDYFKCMFNNDFIESKQDVVDLSDTMVDLEIFEVIINFFYSGEISITEDLVDELMRTAVFLMSKPLQMQCASAMYCHLCPSNALSFWSLSKFINDDKLSALCCETILNNFHSIDKEEFCLLDGSDIIYLVSEFASVVTNENVICDAVCSWLSYHSEDGKCFIEELMKCVRLTFVDPSFILNNLITSNMLMNNEYCKKKITRALEYHFGCRDSNEEPREKYEIEEAYLFFSNNNDECVEISAYPPHLKKFVKLTAFQRHLFLDDFATCKMGNSVYISGGRGRKSFASYSPITNSARINQEMIEKRSAHSMVSSGKSVYAIGGYVMSDHGNQTLSSIEVFSLEDNTWRPFGDLIIPVYGFSDALISNKVYIFGGRTRELGGRSKVFTRLIQCVDLATGACTIIQNVNVPKVMQNYCSNFLYGDVVCLVGKRGHLARFCPECRKIENIGEIKMTPSSRKRFGIRRSSNTMTLFGGFTYDQENQTLREVCDILEVDIFLLGSYLQCSCLKRKSMYYSEVIGEKPMWKKQSLTNLDETGSFENTSGNWSQDTTNEKELERETGAGQSLNKEQRKERTKEKQTEEVIPTSQFTNEGQLLGNASEKPSQEEIIDLQLTREKHSKGCSGRQLASEEQSEGEADKMTTDEGDSRGTTSKRCLVSEDRLEETGDKKSMDEGHSGKPTGKRWSSIEGQLGETACERWPVIEGPSDRSVCKSQKSPNEEQSEGKASESLPVLGPSREISDKTFDERQSADEDQTEGTATESLLVQEATLEISSEIGNNCEIHFVSESSGRHEQKAGPSGVHAQSENCVGRLNTASGNGKVKQEPEKVIITSDKINVITLDAEKCRNLKCEKVFVSKSILKKKLDRRN